VLDLPVNVPWKLIAASPDMMDATFGNKRFPFAWRSSLAIHAYEPKAEDLPDGLCDERITYLKVTCTITGYQPSGMDVVRGYVIFPDVPTEELDRIFREYYACYGVLLNLAVFPHPYTPPVVEQKQINIDFGQQALSYLPNPHYFDQLQFMAWDLQKIALPFGRVRWIPFISQANQIVDEYPAGGDGQGELYFRYAMVVEIPASFRVDAKIVHYSNNPVRMRAYNSSNQEIGSDQTGAQRGQVFDLTVQGDGIVSVMFESSSNNPDRRIDGNQRVLLQTFSCQYLQQKPVDQANYPHIVDFEPKKRDLYQGVTETGEVLTASNSSVSTGKSFTQTRSSETGVDVGAQRGVNVMGIGGTNSAGLSHSWGQTDADTSTVQGDISRERRELNSTTTNLTQMYNLLTGYHAGTNRAVFLMLPRPHILQPTDRRTFIQGLRIIEGIQEFFIVVTRPKDMEGLSIEAVLDTGHFPTYVPMLAPTFEEKEFKWNVPEYASPGEEKIFYKTQKVPEGFVVDLTKGDPGHPGVTQEDSGSNDPGRDSLRAHNYRAMDDSTIEVSARIQGAGAGAIFNRTYKYFTRSQKPQPPPPNLPPIKFFITSRGLWASLKSGQTCPETVSILSPSLVDGRIQPTIFDGTARDGIYHEYIADETAFTIDPALLAGDTIDNMRMPLMKDTLQQIQFAMTTSWKLPTRRPYGSAGFLDSDYFLSQIAKVLPKNVLRKPLSEIGPLPESLLKSLGKKTDNTTFADIINLDLRHFAEKTGMSIEDAILARRTLMEFNGQTKLSSVTNSVKPIKPELNSKKKGGRQRLNSKKKGGRRRLNSKKKGGRRR
jgi:hypothetical protein